MKNSLNRLKKKTTPTLAPHDHIIRMKATKLLVSKIRDLYDGFCDLKLQFIAEKWIKTITLKGFYKTVKKNSPPKV